MALNLNDADHAFLSATVPSDDQLKSLGAPSAQDVGEQFGTWEAIGSRCESLEPMLLKLNVGWIKRQALKAILPSIEISRKKVASAELDKANNAPTPSAGGEVDAIEIKTVTPLGSRQNMLRMDGQTFLFKDGEGVVWTCKASTVRGRLCQLRQCAAGTMRELRVVFPTDPLEEEKCPVMYAQVVFVPSDGTPEIVINRWLRKKK